MHRSIVSLVAILLLAFGTLGVSTTSARTFRYTCRDGVLSKRIACDVDRQSDDIFTFAIPNGVADSFSGPPTHVAVPAGQKHVITYPPSLRFRVVLRCLRHHAVVITTPVPPPGA